MLIILLIILGGVSIFFYFNNNKTSKKPPNNVIFGPGTGNLYYVSLEGNDEASGNSSITAWRTLKFASQQAEAGDIVYIKKGEYGKDRIVTSNTGTSEKPIKFIGYNKIPGDLDMNNPPSDMDAKNMPHISNGAGFIAITFFHEYNEVHNIYADDFLYGVFIKSSNCTIRNLYLAKPMVQGIATNEGSKHTTLLTNIVIDGCTINTISGRAIQFEATDNSVIKNCRIVSDGTTQYFITLHLSDNNLVENCDIRNSDIGPREIGGRAVLIKDVGYNKVVYNKSICSHGNIIRNNYGYLISRAFKINGPAHNNLFENNVADGPPIDSPEGNGRSGFSASGGAHNNIFRNGSIRNYATPFTMGFTTGEYPEIGGYNNIFENIQVVNASFGIVTQINSQPNILKNIVIHNVMNHLYYFHSNNPNVLIKNSILSSINDYIYQDHDISNITLKYEYSCFYNCGFSMPNGEGNIVSDPLFVDSAKQDFHLKSKYGRWDGSKWIKDSVTSQCIDSGNPNDNYNLEPQPNGGRINIGVFGGTTSASKSPSTRKIIK